MTQPNRACPACKAVGRDKHDDHLFLMQDGRTWACSKNNDVHPPHDPYFEGIGTAPSLTEVININQPADRYLQSMQQIEGLGSGAIRNVPEDIVQFYRVKIEYDTTTGQPKTHYYPITSKGSLVSYHIRVLPKQFYHLHKRAELPEHLDLFGMPTMNIPHPNYIIITEGEIDAMAAFVMLAGVKRVQKLRVLSLPTGNNLAAVHQNAALLKKARNLIFCPDQDDAGKKLVPEMWKLFPHIKFMSFSEKDADDMMRLGKVDEFYEAFVHAEGYKPSAVVGTKQLKNQAMQPVSVGLSYPFPSLTKLTYGLRTRQLIGIGAGPGTGKTVLAQTLIMHIVSLGYMCSVFSLEEQPADSLRRMAGHVMGLPIHLPNVPYDQNLLEQILDYFDGKLFYYDHSGYRDWQDIEEVIRFLAFEGVRFFFLDPLSALHTHLGSSETNQFLNNAMFQMSRIIHELDISIFHINHLNNPLGSKDHNEGARAKASQFTGSRSQWRFSTDVWTLRRDAVNPDPVIANTTIFGIEKNRLSGLLGEFNIRYDHKTGRLVEPPLPTAF